MARPSDEDRLLSLIPDDGATIGNRPLCDRLGWSEEKYWRVRERLLEAGVIAKAPGRGGAVRRIMPDDATLEEPSEDARVGTRHRRTQEEIFLSLVPEDGSRITNPELLDWLGWDEEKYVKVREKLVEKGLIVRGPGPGGTVRRSERVVDQDDGNDSPKPASALPRPEKPRVTVIQPQGATKQPQGATKQPQGATKPRIFIGSSVEGLPAAEHLQLGLDHQAECTLWSQGVFGLSTGTLEGLLSAVKKFEFAVLVLTPDDMVYKREATRNSPRDNVLFELGLFMGALGREKTYIVYCRDEKIDLPTDLAGVTAATFAKRSDGNLHAAVGPVCTRIKLAISESKVGKRST